MNKEHSPLSIFYAAQEQMIYMWNVLTAIFFTQVLMVIGYCAALACFPDFWWTCTLCFGIPFAYIAIQNIYIDHDVMHGATFPVYEWQRFLTHPFADFFSLPWEEFVLEHNRHHASTVDLLIQGEFGWDPEEFHYALQQWAGPWGSNWYKYLLTVPFIPVIHFFGLNDTGSLFALEWWMHFPDEGAGGKCNKELPGSIRLMADQSYKKALKTTRPAAGLHVNSLPAQVLEQVDSPPNQAQRLRALPVGLHLAAWYLPSGTSAERGVAVHVHRVLLRSHRLLRGLDVHHQLHS